MFARLAFVSGLALFQPVAGYRVNTKKLMEKIIDVKAQGRPNDTQEDASQLVATESVVAENVTNFVAAENATSLPSMSLGGDPFELMELDFSQTVNASKRSVGNLFAAAGLVRARFVLKLASCVMPASVANKVLPAAMLQEGSAAEDASGSSSSVSKAMKFIGFLVVIVAIFKVSSVLIDMAVQNKKVLGGDGDVTPDDVRECIVACAKIAIPQVIVGLLYMVNEVFSTVAIGQAGTKEQLAAVGCCGMMMNAFLYAFTFGILGPLDALVSTAWGAGDKVLCMAYVNKARLVGLIQAVWIVPIFWHAEPILVFIGQDPLVARHASVFCKVIGLMFLPFFFSLSQFWTLKNMGDPFIGVIGLFLGNFMHVAVCTYLVVLGGWGNTGIAIAWASNQWVNIVVTLFYVAFVSCLKDQPFFRLFFIDFGLCNGIQDYTALAIPSILAQGSESWYWEGITMMVGTMNSTVLAAHVATNNVQAVLMMTPSGLFGAASTIVGQLMGAGKIGVLGAMCKLFPVLAAILWSGFFTFLVFYIPEVSTFFCNDHEVQYIMRHLLGFISISGFFNVMQAVTGGVLRGMAQHRIVAWMVLGNYYLVSFPMAYVLGIKLGYSVYGVYFSFNVGLAMMFTCLFTKLRGMDLQEEARKAVARMEAGMKSADKTRGKDEVEEKLQKN